MNLALPTLSSSLDIIYAGMGGISIPRNVLIPHSTDLMTITVRQATVLAAVALMERYPEFCKIQHHDVSQAEAAWWDVEHGAVDYGTAFEEIEDDYGDLVEKLVPYVSLTCAGHAYVQHIKLASTFMCSDLYIYSYIKETT